MKLGVPDEAFGQQLAELIGWCGAGCLDAVVAEDVRGDTWDAAGGCAFDFVAVCCTAAVDLLGGWSGWVQRQLVAMALERGGLCGLGLDASGRERLLWWSQRGKGFERDLDMVLDAGMGAEAGGFVPLMDAAYRSASAATASTRVLVAAGTEFCGLGGWMLVVGILGCIDSPGDGPCDRGTGCCNLRRPSTAPST